MPDRTFWLDDHGVSTQQPRVLTDSSPTCAQWLDRIGPLGWVPGVGLADPTLIPLRSHSDPTLFLNGIAMIPPIPPNSCAPAQVTIVSHGEYFISSGIGGITSNTIDQKRGISRGIREGSERDQLPALYGSSPKGNSSVNDPDSDRLVFAANGLASLRLSSGAAPDPKTRPEVTWREQSLSAPVSAPIPEGHLS